MNLSISEWLLFLTILLVGISLITIGTYGFMRKDKKKNTIIKYSYTSNIAWIIFGILFIILSFIFFYYSKKYS